MTFKAGDLITPINEVECREATDVTMGRAYKITHAAPEGFREVRFADDAGCTRFRSAAAYKLWAPAFKAGDMLECVNSTSSRLTTGRHYECIGMDGGWVRILCDSGRAGGWYPHTFKKVAAPAFKVGDTVTTCMGTSAIKEGVPYIVLEVAHGERCRLTRDAWRNVDSLTHYKPPASAFKVGDLVSCNANCGYTLTQGLRYRVTDMDGHHVYVADFEGRKSGAWHPDRFTLCKPITSAKPPASAFKVGDIVTSSDPTDLWPFPAQVSAVLPDGRVRLVDPNAPAVSTEGLKLANQAPVSWCLSPPAEALASVMFPGRVSLRFADPSYPPLYMSADEARRVGNSLREACAKASS